MRAPDGDLLARKDPAGNWNYYVKDALGSVIGIYNASGTLTKKYDYDPDGNTWRDSSGKPENFGHTGAYTKTGTGTLYHMGLRWYDPTTARWISPDQLDQPADLQTANPYLYVGSNPLNYTDPNGASFKSWLHKGAKAIGGCAAGALGASYDVVAAPWAVAAGCGWGASAATNDPGRQKGPRARRRHLPMPRLDRRLPEGRRPGLGSGRW